MTLLFVSDLHLDPQRPAVTERFCQFLREEAGAADAVYILGDLFEVWIGDDDDAALAQRVRAALAEVTAHGIPCYLMVGNRDFLIGERFARDTGVALLEDPTPMDLFGEPTILMHGDTLCTDDTEYQAIRRQVRDPEWQRRFLDQGLAERREYAAAARAQSMEYTSGAEAHIMDVNAEAVAEVFRRHEARRLIHGHTHRPGIHRGLVDGRTVERIVLGDWYDQGSVLRCTRSSCRLDTLTVEH